MKVLILSSMLSLIVSTAGPVIAQAPSHIKNGTIVEKVSGFPYETYEGASVTDGC